jgi:sugar O-acyltransferase (sialic acid O-acetyltransferase NeuD family)
VTPLLVVGAGGFAREAVEAVRAVNALHPTWDLLGFLDDDASLAGTRVDGVPVLGPVAEVARHPDAMVVVCTGSPANYTSRKRIVERLGLPPARYARIVHPAASLAGSTMLGEGSVVLAGVVATAAVRIGAHVAVMPGCVFTHDDVVGAYATLGAGVRLAGGVEVAEGAYLGSGALVREHRRVGAWSLVGMGSLVLTDVPDGQVWAGAPARWLRDAAVTLAAAGQARAAS